MVRNWGLEAQRDPYRRRAKLEGYRSRAAYKLIEADKKFRLIKRGDIVVELGAWPGGMAQVAAQLVGPEGLVIAVDVREFKKFQEPNIITLKADILRDDIVEDIFKITKGKGVELLISDASPTFTGIRELDIQRQLELTERALEISLSLVKTGGSVMLKSFESNELRILERELKKNFNIVTRFIPSATRKTSSELYLIGRGKI
ncbi:MAG: RlmE family RNA methyltransferase [Nitrososphaerota archaeon]